MRVVFIVFFVVIFGVATSVFATENVFDHPIPENTFPLELKKLSDRFERFQSIRTRFVQTKKISVLIHQIGRASCRERGEIAVGAVSVKKKRLDRILIVFRVLVTV